MAKPEMKPEFKERMQALLPNKEDFEKYEQIVHISPRNFIRCNTLKISPEELIKRLRKNWKVSQPFENNPEIMIIEQDLLPGELGNCLEHVLGYYYIQEISSMMSALALDAQPGEIVLDLMASPGSKTSQIAAQMQNQGTIIANEIKLDRLMVLSSNLEKAGATNVILTRKDAVALCDRLAKETPFRFDKILVDAPCSGEGTLRSSAKTFLMWNPKVVKKLSRQQMKFISSALKVLKIGGTLVYSTCTHAPEENEQIINFALRNFPVKVESINLPLKCRPGVLEWKDDKFNPDVQKACRIYPQDNDSEGFFVCKMTLMEEIKSNRAFK